MSRLVLFPQGVPRDAEHQQHCTELLHHCGGDLQRVIEAPGGPFSSFLRYAARLPVLRRLTEVPMIVLTQTNPLALKVLQPRRSLEQVFPKLEEALWLIYLNPVDDPFFVEAAASLGSFDDEHGEAPIWTTRDHGKFLIVTPRTKATPALGERITDLEMADFASGTLVKSDVRMKHPDVAHEANTLPPPPGYAGGEGGGRH